MTRHFSYTITESDSNKTIDRFLRSKGFTHQSITELKRQERSILIGDEWMHTSYILKCGDTLDICLSETTTSENIIPIDIPLNIIYEDDDILVINKPARMPIHPSLNHYENTLANAVVHYYTSQGDNFVFRCINRLDRDTTGLTIIAKNLVSAGILSDMMTRREIKREYLAVVEGHPESTDGTIDAPIARIDDSMITRCVDYDRGERAITHYHVEKAADDFSLLRLWLETGRTHQIRVHMSHIGHPLLGDFIYNPKYDAADYVNQPDGVIKPGVLIARQALHAYRLLFNHPITGKSMELIAPVPDDITSLFE